MNNTKPAQRVKDRVKFKTIGRSVLIVALMMLTALPVHAQWTDEGTGVTYTPISGTSGLNGEDYGNGCDGLTTTKHGGTGDGPWYVVLQASSPVRLYGYTIITANDNATYPGRNPKSWKVQGSNDGETWTDIVEVANDATIQDVNYTEFDFTCSTTEYYTYIRFYITAKGTGSYMQYSEFQPWGAPAGDEEGGSVTSNADGYVIYNSGYYLGGASTTGISSFDPSTCIWTGSNGGTWQNSAGYYLWMTNNNIGLSTQYYYATDLGLLNEESGTTGQKLYYAYSYNRYYFLRYNNGWARGNRQNSANTTESGTDIVFAVTKYTHSAEYINPTISGASTINTNGAYRYLMTTIPTYKAGYVDYVFYNNTHHYFAANGTTAIASEPSTENYSSYTWTMSGIGSSYATIDATTGVITYSNSVASTTTATVTLTFTFPSGNTLQATKSVVFEPMTNPTAITPETSSVTICKGVGDTATEVLYTITPTNAYHNIAVTSSNSSVATGTIGGNRGVLSVSIVGTGSATLTLTARNTSGGTAATATVTVNAQDATAKPTFAFDNSTNQVTITSATTGATIYYTTNGTEPTTASTQYTAPFEQSTEATIRAIAVATGRCESEEGTFKVVKLAKPEVEFTNLTGANYTGTATANFSSADYGVTYYYNEYNLDQGGTDPGNPTTSSSSWTAGQANVTMHIAFVAKVITVRSATADTGFINSDVFIRRVNSVNMERHDYVIMYDDGTDVHFMVNASGSVADATTFNPSTAIWKGDLFTNTSSAAQTFMGGAFYYEPFIYYSNSGKYLQIFTGEGGDWDNTGWQDGKLRLTNTPTDSFYFAPRTISGRGILINIDEYDDATYSKTLTFTLGYNTSANAWSRNMATTVANYTNDYFTVVYPVEQLGGSGYTLSVACPTNGSGGTAQISKGGTLTFTPSVTGTYLPVYYRVGNEVKYYYYYPNTSTPMTTEPTGTSDIRFTYELLSGTGYCSLSEGTVTLNYDPGTDRLVTIRITATPYLDGVAQTEGIQTADCQFYILTAPPFPAPVISRVEGTNQYQMTCAAAGSTIVYRINGEASCGTGSEDANFPGWCTYTGPITVVTPGTVISAHSYRDLSVPEVSDQVTYTVGGASLLQPTVTVDDNGLVSITANSDNNTTVLGTDYVGEQWLYTLDGSEPDPSNVGGSNATQRFTPGLKLTNGQTINVIAVDMNSPALFGYSAVSVAHYKINSGLDANNSGIITLNDYENHEWSYYQASADLPAGYPDEMHSPYPRNVKITYYGYGENTLSTSAVAAPAANTFTTATTQGDVKVGIGEVGHTFIYYKTLERDANGRYPYQLIPNPFSVRPDVREYSGEKTVTFTLNDAGGDGWGSSYIQVDYSTSVNGVQTENIEFTESQSTKTVTRTIPTGVTMTLTWVAGGGQNSECSFTVSGYDNNSSTYSSGTGLSSGPVTAIKVTGTEIVTTYTGFYRWRIKSIPTGSLYTASTGGTALAVGDLLTAEQTYYAAQSQNQYPATNSPHR